MIRIAGKIKEAGKPVLYLGRDDENKYYTSENPMDALFQVRSDTWNSIDDKEEILRLLELSTYKRNKTL